MTFRKILCPVDFSAGSDHALQVAAWLAKRDLAELVIAHAWYAGEYALGHYQFPVPALDRIIDEERRGLEAALHDARRHGAERVSARLVHGNPWQEIVELLRQDAGFDLAVIGTRGRTGLSRAILGSVAEKIIRHAPCPVLATRDGMSLPPFRRVLCPIDFTASSRHAMELAAQLVEPGGELVVLHVRHVSASYSTEPSLRTFEDDLDRRIATELDHWAAELRPRTEITVTTRSRVGSAGASILELLDAETFDLVAMGSRGRTGIKRALLGSVAEKVVRHAPCAVVVARRPDET